MTTTDNEIARKILAKNMPTHRPQRQGAKMSPAGACHRGPVKTSILMAGG